MKDFYRIKEIADLYGIGMDSLRYYERLGILDPKRGENGYRLYGTNDMYKLNVIKDLRQLGFSMAQIKNYLRDKTLDSTIDILQEQEKLITEQLKRLNKWKKTIISRRLELKELAAVDFRQVKTVDIPDRRAVFLDVDVRRDEEIDFALNRLQRKYDHKFYAMESYMIGAAQSLNDIRNGLRGRFHAVFFILNEGEKEIKSFIPGGRYVSLHYKGDYSRSDEAINCLITYADEHGLELDDAILELYKIDVHETNDSDEFVTEVQCRVIVS